ncbi:MAG: hypothetical protein RI979_1409 [Pseudomonadota bacterium]
MPVSKTVSMTGFAARRGQGAGHSWAWDIRSVNGKGLDLRLRVPEWIDGLEQALRAEMAKAMGRGNVSLSLKVARDGMSEGAEGLRVNPPALAAVLKAMAEVEQTAMDAGLTLAPANAADVLAVRGVLDTSAALGGGNRHGTAPRRHFGRFARPSGRIRSDAGGRRGCAGPADRGATG